MKFHVLPIPDMSKQKNNDALSKKFRQYAAELITETALTVKKTSKIKPVNCCNTIYYLHDEQSMINLMRKLNEDDEIVVHGEGLPFILGVEEPSSYDLHAQSFAKLLYENKMPHFLLNITLLSCQSATTYAPDDGDININFARDMSTALHAYNYSTVNVTGYAGYVVVKPSSGKYSVSSVLGDSKKGTHAKLDDAKMVYKNGVLVTKGKAMTDLSNVAFSWAKYYIKNAVAGQKIIASIQQAESESPINRSSSQSALSFFSGSQENQLIDRTTNEVSCYSSTTAIN